MTARTHIGGALSYSALAMLHRPTEPARISAEVQRLHTEQHLSAQDISVSLRMAYDQVVNILASTTQSGDSL